MALVVGECPLDRKRRVRSPFLHVALHAKTSTKVVTLPSNTGLCLAYAKEVLTGKQLPHFSERGLRNTPLWEKMVAHEEEVLGWVTSTPPLLNWVISDRAFTAPLEWPERVLKAFAGLPVTPFALANSLPPSNSPPNIYIQHSVCVLGAYASGMGVDDLSALLGVPEKDVIADMVEGTNLLIEYLPFVLWAVGAKTDYLPLGTPQRSSLFKRLNFRVRFDENIMSLSEVSLRYAFPERFLKNPLFIRAIFKGGNPEPVGVYKMVGPPRGDNG